LKKENQMAAASPQGPYIREKRLAIIPVSEEFQPQMNRMYTDKDENGWDRVESVTQTLAD
jgi:hypothetical protein